MPKIYEYFGLIFYFYSNEHEPIHVHVTKNERETIFEIILTDGKLAEIKMREAKNKKALTSKEQEEATTVIHKYYRDIVEKWINFFVLRKEVRMTSIKSKIK